MPVTSPDCDVVVVGAGPVGMVSALLLAAAGHRVVVLERDEQPHRQPRAAVLDDHALRTLAGIGIAERLVPFLSPLRVVDWVGPTGEVVVRHHLADTGRCGWPAYSTVFQPDLDAALEAACAATDFVDLRRGRTVVAVSQGASSVEVTSTGSDGPDHIRAAYAIACDGGDSTVRTILGIGEDDLGFSETWLMCDVRLDTAMDLPADRQIADPAGPRTLLELGNRHYRFGFLIDPMTDPASVTSPEHVWRRVAEYLGPDDGCVVRAHVHEFRSRIAHRWRVDRVLLAGEAAHRLPRHYEQGLSMGLHDAHNLAVTLDLVLNGTRSAELLDCYQLQREPAVTAVLRSAIVAGRAFSLRDPACAAGRDRQVRAEVEAGKPPGLRPRPAISGALFAVRASDGSGELSAHGMVDDGARRVRLDQLVGPGFVVVIDGTALPETDRHPFVVDLIQAGVAVVVIDADATTPGVLAVVDVEGVYGRWMRARGWSAVAIRPDYYVFGAAMGPAGARELAEELLASLGA